LARGTAARAAGEDVSARGAKIVNYADDFVVVARKGAAEVLAQVKRWLVGLKLTLNETKTSIRDARKEHFRFLG
jgi:RNA-directed DNA polymerase